MTELELKIYELVRQIPVGKVSTYGRIAALLGNKKLSRVVGNAMHKNPKPFVELARSVGFTGKLPGFDGENFEPVPCHRVVDASGCMGTNFGMGGPEIQAEMLRAEGISVKNGKVDLIEFAI